MPYRKDIEAPAGAPERHHMGPRRRLITTYFGAGYTVGTAQYAWVDNAQSHGFTATVNTGDTVQPQSAALYYSRMFYDDHCPYLESPRDEYCFRDEGEIRTVQHQNTALVFYNPIPYYGRIQSLHIGVFRSIQYSRPRALFIGEREVPHLNAISDEIAPLAIDEGSVYIGIIPLRLTNLGHSRRAALHIHTYSSMLSILISSQESTGSSTRVTYEQLVQTCSGFVFEIRSASEFPDFAAFRKWLSAAIVQDDYYTYSGVFSSVRTTMYKQDNLCLKTAYSPFQYAFYYTTANGRVTTTPTLEISGMTDPGRALT